MRAAIARVVREVHIREHGDGCPAAFGDEACSCGYDAVQALPDILDMRTATPEKTWTREEVLAFGARVEKAAYGYTGGRGVDLAALLDASKDGAR